jgi:hypothetical protein
MHHRDNSNFDWQMQQQVQLEQLAVWQLWRNNRQQRHTNDLLEQNNQLLEQIRRNTLTPAQRAAEDAAEAERQKQNTKVFCLMLLTLLLVALWFHAHSFSLSASSWAPQEYGA